MAYGMNFDWNSETIEWYLRAEDYQHYYENIVQRILPYVSKEDSLCDLGCGLGLADLFFSPYVKSITAVDIDETPLATLRQCISRSGIENIDVLCLDAEKLIGEWDIVFMSYFGTHDVAKFLPLCRRMFLVIDCEGNPLLTPEGRQRSKRFRADAAESYFKELGLTYIRRDVRLESGQPFESLAEAGRFVLNLAPDLDSEELEAFLWDRVENTGRRDYPFFLSRMKKTAIFEIKGGLA